MTLTQLLQQPRDDLSLLEAVGDRLADREAPASTAERTILALWIYIATNPNWNPPPVDRNEVEAALRAVELPSLANELPPMLSPPEFDMASRILKACVQYLRAHQAEFDLGENLQPPKPDSPMPLPPERMAAIFRGPRPSS